MAVSTPPQTRYMDGSVQRTTQVYNPIPTSFFHLCFLYKDVSSNLTAKFRYTFYSKKDVGMGLLV